MQDKIDHQIEDRNQDASENLYNGGINLDVFCCVRGLERKPLKERRPPKSNMVTLWDYGYRNRAIRA
jgi:hypothetical protein